MVERALPVAVVPGDALVEAPVGRVALVALFPGEPVLADRVAPDGLRGVAALLPPGTRALTVPTGPGSPPVVEGDVVDVLVTVDPGGGDPGGGDPGGGDPTFPLVELAPVVAVGEAGTTIAVPTVDAARVAFALAAGRVTLALAAPG